MDDEISWPYIIFIEAVTRVNCQGKLLSMLEEIFYNTHYLC